jgi:hypothetical protein
VLKEEKPYGIPVHVILQYGEYFIRFHETWITSLMAFFITGSRDDVMFNSNGTRS